MSISKFLVGMQNGTATLKISLLLIKVNNTYDCTIRLLGVYPRQMKMDVQKFMQNVYGSSVHNCFKPETPKVCIKWIKSYTID
jgi:hypothetical protein